MKYYESLVDLKCFSRSDVERLTKNKYTADSLIKEYKRKGYIESVRRNLFVAASMETKGPVANRYLIATNILRAKRGEIEPLARRFRASHALEESHPAH